MITTRRIVLSERAACLIGKLVCDHGAQVESSGVVVGRDIITFRLHCTFIGTIIDVRFV